MKTCSQTSRIIATATASVLVHVIALAMLGPAAPLVPASSPLVLALEQHDSEQPEPSPAQSTPTTAMATTPPAAPRPSRQARALQAAMSPDPAASEPASEVNGSFAETGAAIPATPGRQPTTDDRAHIRRSIGRQLAARFHYPALARKRGWEGNVVLQLRLAADGRMTTVRLAESSGRSVLDRAALTSARSIRMLPDTVPWLAGRPIDLLIPVHYRLTDS